MASPVKSRLTAMLTNSRLSLKWQTVQEKIRLEHFAIAILAPTLNVKPKQ
jgi:hypothetical protein